MQQVLVTGASGFIGNSLMKIAKGSYTIIGTCFKNQQSSCMQLDLTDKDAVATHLLDLQLDGIIHLAANGNINDCEKNPETSANINVRATEHLLELAKSKNIPIVFASTDQVFDGKKGNYLEHEPPSPLHNYGKQKLQSEKLLIEKYSKSVICRLPLVLGEYGGYMKHLMEQLKNGKQQHLFIDEYRTPCFVEDVADGLLKALEWQPGLYHLGGVNNLNRFEIALAIAQNANLDATLLRKTTLSKVNLSTPRPANLSLISTKAYQLGYQPKSILTEV